MFLENLKNKILNQKTDTTFENGTSGKLISKQYGSSNGVSSRMGVL